MEGTAAPFFSRPGLNVDTYDERVRDVAAQSGDVAFYVERAQTLGGPVLLIGSGTGRIAWEIAQAGVEVIGLERSAPMLEAAQRRGAELGDEVRERVRFVAGDMTSFDLHRTFPLVIVPFHTFHMLLTGEDQRRALLAVRRHLNPGGRLVIHNFDPRLEWLSPGAAVPNQPREVRRPAAGSLVRVVPGLRDNDPVQQVMREVWTFSEVGADGAVVAEEQEELAMRWVYRHEMRYLLELTGFVVEAEHSDFQLSPPAYGNEQIWLARRSVPSPGRG
jgi:SAM-dependent methyltransferase